MILHAVYFAVPSDSDPSELSNVMVGLSELVGQIMGFTAFQHGPNIDVEGLSPEAQYGFHATFDNRAALDRYAADPRHRALGKRLLALCGGPDAIKVYDIET